MGGNGGYEAELSRIREIQDWRIPKAYALRNALRSLDRTIGAITESDEAWKGVAADQARVVLMKLKDQFRDIDRHVETIDQAVEEGNSARRSAVADAELPSAQIDPFWEGLARGGSVVVHPVLGPLAADKALDVIGDFLGNQREEAAKASVERVERDLRRPTDKLRTARRDLANTNVKGISSGSSGPEGSSPEGTYPGGGDPGGPGYPGYPTSPSSPPPGGTAPPSGPPSGPDYPSDPDYPTHPTDPDYPFYPTDPDYPTRPTDPDYPFYPTDPDYPTVPDVPDDPSVDGPGGGGITPGGPGGNYPGGPGGNYPGGPGGTLPGGPGVTPGGTLPGGGSGVPGAVGGGAGAAAITAGSKIAGVGGMGGIGGAGMGGVAGSGGRGGSGGLLGRTPAAGGATGTRGGAGAGTGSGSGGAAGGRPGAMMGGAGAGGQSGKRQKRSGLGGPIAPQIEDEDDMIPRAKSAQAGSRDDYAD